MEYNKTVQVDKSTAIDINQKLRMTPDELRALDIMPRQKLLHLGAKFSDGFFMVIDVYSCDEELPYVEAILFSNDGVELACKVCDGHLENSYCLTSGKARNKYTLVIATDK